MNATTGYLQRIAAAHAAFQKACARRVRRYEVARMTRHGRAELVWVEDPIGEMLDDRWQPRQTVQAESLRAYLLELAEIRLQLTQAKVTDLPELQAHCALLEVSGALELPPSTRLPALDFRRTKFLDDVTFRDLAFLGHANFHRADFLGEADFDNAHFHQGGDFRRTVFCKSAGFFCAMGEDGDKVDFSLATFVGYADFEGYISHHFEFNDVKYLGGTDFS